MLIRELSTGTFTPGRSSRRAIILAVILALVEVGMAVYLLVLRWPIA